MVCKDEMGLLLSKYVDNEASPEERSHIEEHLVGCAGCKEMLSIFLRNESMVSKSLSREQFGERMVDRVIYRIDGPAEAEPTEATRWERFLEALRERPWIPLAAAVFVVLAMGIVSALHVAADRTLRHQVDALRRTVDDHERAILANSLSEQRRHEAIVSRMRQMHQELIRERLKNSLDIPGNSSLAAIVYQAIVVRARFANRENYLSYAVWRSVDDGKTYSEIKSGLSDSEYEDTDIVPGRVYWYKFVGRKRNLETAESVPVRLQAPPRGGLDPEKCLRIQCVEIGENKNVATFTITRYVQRTPVTSYFTVVLGEKLGRVEQTPNGRVDFSTDLEFETAESGDETIKATFAWPKFDPETKEPIYDSAGRQGFELRDQILSVRKNERAVLRPAAHSKGRSTVKIWREGELLIPIEGK